MYNCRDNMKKFEIAEYRQIVNDLEHVIPTEFGMANHIKEFSLISAVRSKTVKVIESDKTYKNVNIECKLLKQSIENVSFENCSVSLSIDCCYAANITLSNCDISSLIISETNIDHITIKHSNSRYIRLDSGIYYNMYISDSMLKNLRIDSSILKNPTIEHNVCEDVDISDSKINSFDGVVLNENLLAKVEIWNSQFIAVGLTCNDIGFFRSTNSDFVCSSFLGSRFKDVSFLSSNVEKLTFEKESNIADCCFNNCTGTGRELPTSEFHGYKSIEGSCLDHHIIADLIIPSDSKKLMVMSDLQARCDKCIVDHFEDLKGNILQNVISVDHFSNFGTINYTVGKVTECDEFDDNHFNSCTHGIHFFLNKKDAVDRANLN